MMRQMQLPSQMCSTEPVSMTMDNGQLCMINAPFQPLPNVPSCFTGLYAKMTRQ